MRTTRQLLVAASMLVGIALTADDAPTPEDRQVAQAVERLSTDPFALGRRLFDPERELHARTAKLQREYYSVLRERLTQANQQAEREYLPRVQALLGPEAGKAFAAANSVCIEHRRRQAEIKARPGTVLDEVAGETLYLGVSDHLRVAASLPGLPEETVKKLNEKLTEQMGKVYQDAETQALDGKKRPSIMTRDRKAYKIYKSKRRALRTELTTQRREQHAAELQALLPEEQAATLAKVVAAVAQRDTELAALRAQLPADLEKALGEGAVKAAEDRIRENYAAITPPPDIPLQDEDIERQLFVPYDLFGVVRTYFVVSEEQQEKLDELATELHAKRSEASKVASAEVQATFAERLIALLAEGDREQFREVRKIVSEYVTAKDALTAPYTEAATAAGMRFTHFPSHMTTFVHYLTIDMEANARKKVTDAMNQIGRNRYRDVQAELKKRGVNKDDPNYQAVQAEVNAAVSERVEKRQIGEVRKRLSDDRAATLDTLLPIWRKVTQDRLELAVATGRKVAAIVGLDALLGR